jgi:chromosome partitioning protein
MAAFVSTALQGLNAPQRIVVTNAKGGCGKTTLATNLAGYLAMAGNAVALYDFDPQGSSMQWLRARNENRPLIRGVTACVQPGQAVTRSWQLRVPPGTQVIVADTPAGVAGQELLDIVRGTDVILIPVCPSPIDIHAAARFIRDLLIVGKARQHRVRLAVVANRVRLNTRTHESLQRFLAGLNIPFITSLRDTQLYARAAEEGLCIHELEEPRARRDVEQWHPLVEWVGVDVPNPAVTQPGQVPQEPRSDPDLASGPEPAATLPEQGGAPSGDVAGDRALSQSPGQPDPSASDVNREQTPPSQEQEKVPEVPTFLRNPQNR